MRARVSPHCRAFPAAVVLVVLICDYARGQAPWCEGSSCTGLLHCANGRSVKEAGTCTALGYADLSANGNVFCKGDVAQWQQTMMTRQECTASDYEEGGHCCRSSNAIGTPSVAVTAVMGTPVDDELSFYDGLDIDPHNVALETWWVPTVAVADFNEDGHVDLFVSEREKKGAGKRENRLYFGTGTGTFTDPPGGHVGPQTDGAPHNANDRWKGQFTMHTVAVDVNHDGHMDLCSFGRYSTEIARTR